MISWNAIPDVGTITLLAIAFASVSRRNPSPVSKLWLTAWYMIGLHFCAAVFFEAPGIWGTLAQAVGMTALIWAGLVFMWAAVPDRHEGHSRLLLITLLALNTLYITLLTIGPSAAWALDPVAAMLGGLPLTVAAVNWSKFNHPLRRGMIAHYFALSIFLLLVQHRPGNGDFLAENAVLFTVYLGCCLHFWYMSRRASTGAFITIAGFLAWALVFVVGPAFALLWPNIPIDSEVWNLPKYVVALGMILIVLEDQIEHNQYLALHDHLTALPNRRLFQDRLAHTLDGAARTRRHAALMVIDLDGFKDVNDQLGHHVGDLLLKHVSTLFLSSVRRGDTVARTGGDEFCIILEETANRQQALEVARTLMHLISQPLQLAGNTVNVGASIGIAVFPEDATTMETLCIKADLRMYETKNRAGRISEAWTLGATGPYPTRFPQRHVSLGLVAPSVLPN